jgi:hypothetical protein
MAMAFGFLEENQIEDASSGHKQRAVIDACALSMTLEGIDWRLPNTPCYG